MSQKGCERYNPVCLTLVFLFGLIIGSFTTHAEHSVLRSLYAIIITAIAFHLTHFNPKGLFQKVFSKGS